MKLKKIASLMLAGVMAVSMLAGCSGNSTIDDNNTDNDNQGDVSTSSVVSAIDDAIKTYSDATVEVKESAFLNTRLESLTENWSYQELTNYDLVEKNLQSIFGKKMAELSIMKDKDLVEIARDGEKWYYDIVTVDKVSGTTPLVKAANQIAPKLAGLKDEYICSELTGWKGHGWGNHGSVMVDVSYTADYTMYVSQVTSTKTGDTALPVFIVVLQAKAAQKV